MRRAARLLRAHALESGFVLPPLRKNKKALPVPTRHDSQSVSLHGGHATIRRSRGFESAEKQTKKEEPTAPFAEKQATSHTISTIIQSHP